MSSVNKPTSEKKKAGRPPRSKSKDDSDVDETELGGNLDVKDEHGMDDKDAPPAAGSAVGAAHQSDDGIQPSSQTPPVGTGDTVVRSDLANPTLAMLMSNMAAMQKSIEMLTLQVNKQVSVPMVLPSVAVSGHGSQPHDDHYPLDADANGGTSSTIYDISAGGRHRSRSRRRYSYDSDDQYHEDPVLKMNIKITPFDGKSVSVQEWLDRFETIVKVKGWDDADAIRICAVNLESNAMQWYLHEGKLKRDWLSFKSALVKRFTKKCNPLLVRTYTQHIKQRDKETSEDFMDRVRNELKAMSVTGDSEIAGVFTSGLRPPLLQNVILQIGDDEKSPEELVRAATRAEMARGELTSLSGSFNSKPRSTVYTSADTLKITCWKCHQPGHRANNCTRSSAGTNSSGTMSGSVKEVKCFYCGEVGHIKPNCPKLKSKSSTDESQGRSGNQGIPGRPNPFPSKNGVRAIVTERQDYEYESTDEHVSDDDEQQSRKPVAGIRRVNVIAKLKKEQQDNAGVMSVMSNIHGVAVNMTIDTGADNVSCLSEARFKLLHPEIRKQMSTSDMDTLVAVDGERIDTMGKIMLPIRVPILNCDGHLEIDVCFYVVPDMSIHAILGCDFLLKYTTRIEYAAVGKEYMLLATGDKVPIVIQRMLPDDADDKKLVGKYASNTGGTKAKRSSEPCSGTEKKKKPVLRIRLTKAVTLPARCISYIKDAVVDSQGVDVTEDAPGNVLLAELDQHQAKKDVLMPYTVYSVNSRTLPVLQLTNVSDRAVELAEGDVVGTLHSAHVFSDEEVKDIEKSMETREEVAQQIEGKLNDTIHTAIESQQVKIKMSKLLHKFAHILDSKNIGKARYGGTVIEHTIDTGDAKPIYQHAYRQSPAMEAIIQKEIDELLANDVIEPSSSPWASPIVMVKKKDNTWRMCIDYRKLNAVTTPDVYPLPPIDTLLYNMQKAKVFTTLDLQSAYNQVTVAEADRPKTTLIYVGGTYRYKRMPFGLRNAPATFQRLMNAIMSGIPDVMCYLDDVIIYSEDIDTHIVDLDRVFGQLSKHGLKVKLSKCDIAKTCVHYLGHVIDGTGVHCDPVKVQGVNDMPQPKNVKDIQVFLGMVGYYKRFIPKYANVANALFKLLRTGVDFIWTDECGQAFKALKDKLVTAPVLAMPDYSKPFILQTDASMIGIGAALCQVYTIDSFEVEKPVAYASRALRKHEKNYAVTHLELLALIYAIKVFKHYILGSKFYVQTDHRALQWIRNTKETTGRLARWALTLQEYDFDIIYKKGKLNANADALSRLVPALDQKQIGENNKPVSHMVMALKSTPTCKVLTSTVAVRFATKQKDDPSWANIYRYSEKPDVPILGLSKAQYDELKQECTHYVLVDEVLHHIYFSNNRASDDGVILQICVPGSMISDILYELHDAEFSGHLLAHKTYLKALNRYWWPGMYSTIEKYCKSCEVCMRRKQTYRKQQLPMMSPQVDMVNKYGAMQCIAYDVIGPLPTARGRKSLILTIVDHYTRYGQAYPLSKQTTHNIVQVLVDKWIMTHGVPKTIVSDNGSGFTSKPMRAVLKLLGIKTRYILPYHPQSNGICERLNGTIISMLSTYVHDKQYLWSDYLPYVLFAYNTSTHPALGYTPYKMVHGREAIIGSEAMLSADTDVQSYPQYIQEIQQKMSQAHAHIKQRVQLQADNRDGENVINSSKSTVGYDIGDEVMVYYIPRSKKDEGISKKLLLPYQGPYIVIQKFNEVAYQCRHKETGKTIATHASRMKLISRRAPILPQINSLSDSEHDNGNLLSSGSDITSDEAQSSDDDIADDDIVRDNINDNSISSENELEEGEVRFA
jgi:RNase H-like domain found in reverse transcriptase/Reverse transcriptase (RNA-dependent DNA polymerase)/Integrase zinc binding domain/Integrase core domain/Zinc knuckle